MADASQHGEHETVLDVTGQQIARVYAQALLGAAVKADKLEQVLDELSSLVADVLDRHPRLEATLTSALVSPEEKETLLDRIFRGRASPQLLSFLKVLARHNRLVLLRGVLSQLHDLYMEHIGKVDVYVGAARDLDDASRQQLRQILNQRLQAEPEIHVSVDPALIAGLVITVGDTVYDGSIATRLAKARKMMVNKAVEIIETNRTRLLTDEV